MANHEFDYLIVGAGSAGCVLANRLGEDPTVRILLLEAGPADKSWTIDMPSAVGLVVGGTRYNWSYSSEPEPYLDGRRIGHFLAGRLASGQHADKLSSVIDNRPARSTPLVGQLEQIGK